MSEKQGSDFENSDASYKNSASLPKKSGSEKVIKKSKTEKYSFSQSPVKGSKKLKRFNTNKVKKVIKGSGKKKRCNVSGDSDADGKNLLFLFLIVLLYRHEF